jgi:hypothetical protein
LFARTDRFDHLTLIVLQSESQRRRRKRSRPNAALYLKAFRLLNSVLADWLATTIEADSAD